MVRWLLQDLAHHVALPPCVIFFIKKTSGNLPICIQIFLNFEFCEFFVYLDNSP